MWSRVPSSGGVWPEPHSGGVCRWHDGLGVRRRRLWKTGTWKLHSQVLASGQWHAPSLPSQVGDVELASSKESFDLLTPQKVDVLCGISIKKVACGTQFSVALTKDGKVFTFGQGKVPFLLLFVYLTALCGLY